MNESEGVIEQTDRLVQRTEVLVKEGRRSLAESAALRQSMEASLAAMMGQVTEGMSHAERLRIEAEIISRLEESGGLDALPPPGTPGHPPPRRRRMLRAMV